MGEWAHRRMGDGAKTSGGEPLWRVPNDLSIFDISLTLPEHVNEGGSRQLPPGYFLPKRFFIRFMRDRWKQSAGLFPGAACCARF
jgi:hypothetical protein